MATSAQDKANFGFPLAYNTCAKIGELNKYGLHYIFVYLLQVLHFLRHGETEMNAWLLDHPDADSPDSDIDPML